MVIPVIAVSGQPPRRRRPGPTLGVCGRRRWRGGDLWWLDALGTVCAMRRRQWAWLVATVGWTLFVWIQRVRNALGDASLGDGALVGVLLLSASFVIGALVVAWLAWRGRGAPVSLALVRVVWLLTAWSTVASRITDIAVAGEHEVGFVAVHTVIGLASVMLWAITAFLIIERDSEEIAPVS